MAQQVKEIKKTYPLPAYNFRVDILNTAFGISGTAGSSGVMPARFSEVSGLEFSISPVVYRDGFSFVTGPALIAGAEQEVKLSLKRGIVAKDSFLYNWLAETRSVITRGKKDLHIMLCDEEGVGIVHWNVHGALPIKLTGPSFSAETNDVAIETLDLIAASVRMEFSE